MMSALTVAQSLERWYRERGEERVVEVTGRATVGLSQETWFVRTAAGGDEVDGVLRLPTAASGSRAILTQIRSLRQVAGTVPAPAVLEAEEDSENPFGLPFLLMERISGSVPVGWHVLEASARNDLAEQAVDTLAALHAVRTRAAADGRPGPTELDFWLRRLERLAPLPAVLTGALWWLRRHAAPAPAPAFVHGDYRMGNMVVRDGRLVGVLDWEMAGPGDPLVDLAWCFIPLWEPALVDEAPLWRRYEERSGRQVDPERLHWHRILGYVRLAGYSLGAAAAFDSGASDDLRLAALRLQVPIHLSRLAATLAREPVEA
jgi:aminoglycoside phosphotransferase (APT) family kinase protein